MCRSRKVHALEEDFSDEDCEDFYVGSIEKKSNPENTWMVNLNINSKVTKFKMDTGAQANVISYKVFKMIKGDSKLIPSKTRLVTYSGEKMNVLGKCNLKVLHKDKVENLEFVVVNFSAPCILGLQSCEKLNLISRVMSVENNSESLLKEYSEIFQGFGDIEGYYHIEIDKSVQPIVHPPRRVPIALRDK